MPVDALAPALRRRLVREAAFAASRGDCEVLVSLLEAGISPSACTRRGERLIEVARAHRQERAAQVLVRFGASVDGPVVPAPWGVWRLRGVFDRWLQAPRVA